MLAFVVWPNICHCFLLFPCVFQSGFTCGLDSNRPRPFAAVSAVDVPAGPAQERVERN